MVRNFSSNRCREDYKKDIAIHFLEGDAHNWWLALDKRTNGSIERFSDNEVEFNQKYCFSDYEVEFNHKYFLAEAWEHLESKFLDLVRVARQFGSTKRSSIVSDAMWVRTWRTRQFRLAGSSEA